ncbi:MAG: hypothetical protein N2322_07370 [Terrimicrobiaceae bacterium]|nr:hypothetical protein [Terrimicrobiaceae bacterium]
MRAALPLIYSGSEADTQSLAEFIVASPAAGPAFRQMAETVLPLSPRESGTHHDLLLMRMPGAPPPPPEGMPALFAHGTEDPFAPMEAAREFASKRPGTRFVPVEKGGHLLWIGPDGARAAETIRLFLEEAAKSGPQAPAAAGD